MARTAIPKTALVGPYVATVAANALDLTFTAADTVNQNSIAFGNSGRLLVLFRNTSTTTAYTVTINSVAAGGLGFRTNDITGYSLGAGEEGAYIAVRLGWEQADTLLYLEANNAEVEFAAADI